MAGRGGLYKCDTWLNRKAVVRAVEEASQDPLRDCAVLVQSTARALLSVPGGGVPSPPGDPPHLQTGNLMRNIHIAKSWRGSWLIGPTVIAWYGKLHEFGLGKFPLRPFMRPALARTFMQYKKLFKNLKLRKTKGGRRLLTESQSRRR